MISINGNAEDHRMGGGQETAPQLSPAELVDAFVARVDRLEKRYEGDAYVKSWLMSADELKAVRDRLTGREQRKLFE
jgi:dihydrofolate reductase